MYKIVEKAYRYRFYPTDDQKEYLARTFGCCRFTYNYFLDLKTGLWKEEKKRVSYSECSTLLRSLKHEYPWLKEVSSVCLQQSLRHLDKAFDRFFKRQAKYPKFKKRAYEQSASYMKNSFTYVDGEIRLAKQKQPLGIRWSRRFTGTPNSLTVTRESAGRYYISIHVKEVVQAFPFKPREVGLDLGLKDTITTNTGEVVCNPRFLEKKQKTLRKGQKTLARRKKGSNNYKKARIALAIAYAKIRDKRHDFLHKLSTKLVNENQVIAIESLTVKKMIQNKYLSRSISDVGWTTLVRFLEYKCDWYGKDLVRVDTFFPSSKLCSHCGYKLEELSLSTRQWKCPQCSEVHDRDKNAAKNVLAEGLKQFAPINQSTVGRTGFYACGACVRP